MRERTWRWFNVRMSALINNPSTRIHAAIMAAHNADRPEA